MRGEIWLSLAAVVLAGGAAQAQEVGEAAAASLYGPSKADVAAAPSNDEVMAAWPAKAAARRTEGSAVARCTAAPSGVLSDCQVMLQRPEGAGFGEALLALAPKYRMKPAAEADRPAGTEVVISASWPAADTPPDWRVQPKPGDFATTATPAISHGHLAGRAVMNCLLGKLGTTHQCVVVYQNPPGKGFGTMLLRFAPYLKLKPALVAGKPVVYGVNIPMNFGPPVANLTY
ncbi:MAG: hypothetical protein JWP28_3384 [Phenylobacterium sp.]|jgi:TonB family protein|uniref:energy transducer TonB family protein n=1 Tax=Phenylobacterium sp. TaxID=1871053 RepID=UPI0026157F19|nr:energy transducer TonB [Phenylobacterium sp.]MDB5464099.1 hypothetical protein [Phenylobacterium sp.]MDB5499353.1 hypothetical protein [Phenylobacterium sp.]